jgi:hypothetical protein
MKIRPHHTALLLSALAGLTSATSHAGIVGDTVSMWRTPQLTGEPTLDSFAIVTHPGHEFSSTIGNTVLYTVDIGPNFVRLDSFSNWHSPWFNTGFAPSSIEIRDMDFGPGLWITGVEVSYSSNIVKHNSAPADLPFFSADNISFNADTVRITYGGHEFFDGSWVHINLIVTPSPAGLGVLAGAGLLACRRRRA